MTGEKLKNRISELTGKKQAEVAEMLGVSPQALNSLFKASDVRSGLIEEVCSVFKIPLSCLYGEAGFSSAAGDGSTSVAGVGNNVNATDALVRAIDEISAQRRVTEDVVSQNGRLLSIIEKMQG